jgi:hypothetical protein
MTKQMGLFGNDQRRQAFVDFFQEHLGVFD